MRRDHDEDLFKDTTMTFGEHLEELRTCLWRAVLGLAIGFVLGLYFGGEVVDFIEIPLKDALTAYYQDQSAAEVEARLAELREAGYRLPEDPDEILNLITEKNLKLEEVYVNPSELLLLLKEADPKRFADVALPAEDSQPAADADLVPVFLWHKIEKDVRVTSLSAHEPFLIYIKASLLLGALLASPWIFYQIWSFVAAGLYPHEKRYIHVFLPFSLGLFFAGAALAFFFVFGPVLRFLFHFNDALGIAQDIRISEWLGFVLILPLGFGISFQLPLVMLFMHRIGIFDVQAYLSKWRVAILIIFVLAMFLTPADPTSMILMAAPLTVLYFGGILLCKYMPGGGRSPFDDELEEQKKKERSGPAEQSKGSRLWFFLKMVIVAILVVLLIVWRPMQEAGEQRAAVAEIERLGGKLLYDYQLDESGRPIEGAVPAGWSVLRRLLGDDFFNTVVQVNLSGTEPDEAALESFKGLAGLKKLDLRATRVTQQAVEQLQAALPNCEITVDTD